MLFLCKRAIFNLFHRFFYVKNSFPFRSVAMYLHFYFPVILALQVFYVEIAAINQLSLCFHLLFKHLCTIDINRGELY
jgi:hypothetical protein